MPNNVRNQGFGTTAELAATNPVLGAQETWRDTTLGRTKTGPGLWNDLAFDDQYAEDHGGGSGTSVLDDPPWWQSTNTDQSSPLNGLTFVWDTPVEHGTSFLSLTESDPGVSGFDTLTLLDDATIQLFLLFSTSPGAAFDGLVSFTFGGSLGASGLLTLLPSVTERISPTTATRRPAMPNTLPVIRAASGDTLTVVCGSAASAGTVTDNGSILVVTRLA